MTERFSAEEMLRRVAVGMRDDSVPIDREATAAFLEKVAAKLGHLRSLVGAVSPGPSLADLKGVKPGDA